MRERTERCVVTFRTTAGAMAMEGACREAGLPGRLIPVPRQISAGCGMAWCAPGPARPGLEQLIREREIEVEGVYELFL